MSVSAPFIHRPVATTLLTVAVALAGGAAYTLLPVSPLPQVEFPTISVSAGLPGASPETMAASVATPLERQLGRIAGVTEMTSTSGLGSTQVTLQFDLDRDIDAAARDVQAAVNAARGQLPANLPSNPSYRKVNPADAPILLLALTSDVVERARMYDIASSILQQRLAQVRGVGQVVVGGGALPAVRVDVNPTALSNNGLGLEDLRASLAAANVNRPKGELAGDTRSWSLTATDQLLKASEYRPLVIRYANGAALRLGDVAQVTDSVEDIRAGGLSNGQPAVLLIVFREPGANIIDTVDGVRAVLPGLQESIPPTIRLSMVIDATRTIRASVRDVERTLLIAIALVILVVFAFLRDLRSTLIPTVAVPISLIGTFGVMFLLGYSLDNLSLMAMTVATGFVVDDAIVVIENITRHLEAGLAPPAAALRGAAEIGFTVISISVSLVAVFIPILLMGGIVGRLFREFAVVLSVAIGVSLLVSLTTTPMMCARLLRPRGEERHGALYRRSERVFAWILGRYEASLRWVLGHQRPVMLVTLLTMVATACLYVKVPKGFFPQQDTGRLNGSIQADQDTSFKAMQDKLARFVASVMQDPAVESVNAFVGGGSFNTARMFVGLKATGERDATADQVIARLRTRTARVPGATLFLQPVQDVRVGGRVGAAQYQYTLQGDDANELQQWAPRVLAKLRTLPQLADLNSDQQDRGLQAALAIDRSTASRLGVTPQMIDDTLYDAFGQRPVSTMYTPLNQYHVVMEVEPRFWQGPDGLKSVYVRASTGSLVPLSAFARYQSRTAPLAVTHQAQFPSVTLSFNLRPGVALGTAVDAINRAQAELALPASIRGTFQGTAQAFQASLANEPVLVAAALLAVYIVLGILYESLIHPITILSTLPSAGVGALLALLLCRIELSVIALIGIILLIGIVKKNAILMIDFAIEAERGEGKSPQDAIFQACLLRFRPIIMTTMAAVLGGLPLAIGMGTGSELRRPLGIAIVGGLLFSQALTLFTTPVVYLYLDRLRLQWRGLLAAGLALLGAGCAVGPNYQRPSAPVPPAYAEQASDWKAAEPRDQALRGKWWEAFGDAQLDALEDQVGVSNQTLAQAEAAFHGARAAVRDARADFLPTVTASPSVTRSHSSRNSATLPAGAAAATITSYQLPVDVSYEADVWGRIRRNVEGSVASAQASAADLETVRLTLQAELAVDFFELRGLDAQQRLLDATVAAYEKALELTINRHDQGLASGVDVAQAETQLQAARAQASDVGVARAQFAHAIATLAGKPPEDLTIPVTAVDDVPPAIPLELPSELLERRPDIAASERRVAAANARIGAAKAAFFPRVLLAASGGYGSSTVKNLFSAASRFWAIGPSIAATLLDGGHRRAAREEAQASYEGAVAGYRQTVLSAFQEVEDNLAALRILAEEADRQAEAVAAAQRSLTLATNRYRAGVTTYLEVITAQNAALANQRAAVDVQARRMTASVNLIKALGGGWRAAELPTAFRSSQRSTP